MGWEFIEEKRPHLYWTPSIAHCIDFMLEDIRKFPFIKKTIQSEVSPIGFIYNHFNSLILLR